MAVTLEESTTFHVTVVVTPTGKDSGASLDMVRSVSVSWVALAVPMSITMVDPVASTVTSGGAVMFREDRITVMSCVSVAELWYLSSAVHVMVVVRPASNEVVALLVIVGDGSTKSSAVAVP